MPLTAWPAGSDVAAFLAAAGLTVGSGLLGELDTMANAAVADLEKATGRQFIAASGTETYDAPTGAAGLVLLRRDLLSVSGLTRSGSAQISGTDYRLVSLERNSDRAPVYYAVQFQAPAYAFPGSAGWDGVSITGTWGYGTNVPPGAWQGVLNRAAWLAAPSLILGFSGGFVSWTEADVTENYGQNPLAALMKAWGGDDGLGGAFGGAVRLYARWAPG